jgi:2-dehydropantoate 2-reductase
MTLDDMASVLGSERTLGAVIEISANMFEPGIINRQSPRDRSWFAVGSFSHLTRGREEQVADILASAGTVEVSDDIRSSKWMKLVVNAAELAPSAILGLPLGAAARVPGMRDLMAEAGSEAIRTAIALGNRPRPIFGLDDADLAEPDAFAGRLLDRVLTHYTLDDTRTTILQDWMKGRRAETDEINGLVVREQERLGGSAPVNARVVELARRIEAGDLVPHPSNADLLLAERVA